MVAIWGKYRRQLYEIFDKIKYNQRNITETAFSLSKGSLERYFGQKKFHNQVKEIKLKLIVCNMNKKISEII